MKLNVSRYLIGSGAVVAAILLGVGGAYGYRLTAGSRLMIRDYMRTHSVRKLQIGAGGTNLSGWLNSDVEPVPGEAYLDATKTFPIPDSSLSYIFSEDVVEHLSYSEGLFMLRESYRTLKPGGRVRIATPNLLKLVRLFTDPKTDDTRSYIQNKVAVDNWPETASPECIIINFEMHSYGHKFVYDPVTLRQSLELAGFQSITEFAPGESSDPQLAGLEVRHSQKVKLHSMHDYETMVLEAVRP